LSPCCSLFHCARSRSTSTITRIPSPRSSGAFTSRPRARPTHAGLRRAVALLHSFAYPEAGRRSGHRREGSRLRHGAVGHRDELLPHDLGPSDSVEFRGRPEGGGEGRITRAQGDPA
jgi:hypothetical protein